MSMQTAPLTSKTGINPLSCSAPEQLLVQLNNVGKVYPNGTIAVQNANLDYRRVNFYPS